MTLGTKIDQLIKPVDLLRTEVQNTKSKLDSLESRLAKVEDKVETRKKLFLRKYLKKRILKKPVYRKKQAEK